MKAVRACRRHVCDYVDQGHHNNIYPTKYDDKYVHTRVDRVSMTQRRDDAFNCNFNGKNLIKSTR